MIRRSAVTLAALAALALTGCASTGAPQLVATAVPVVCQEPMPERPAMPTEALAGDASLFGFVTAAQAEIERREGYELRLRIALAACRAPLEADP